MNATYDPIPPSASHLPDGRRAYWQTDEFGCFTNALATVVGVEPSELPQPRDHAGHTKADQRESEARTHYWLCEHGWRIRYRDFSAEGWLDHLPDGTRIRRPIEGLWIGVSVDPRPGWDHCVVLDGRRVVFDPALRLAPPPGMEHEQINTVHYAITLERKAP